MNSLPQEPAQSAATNSSPGRKRVLFVDDETTILDLFCLMFSPTTTAWDASFANSGTEALTLMEQKPFDIVITDMRMPGMNGAQLLSEVMQRYPQTARLILSGYADQEEVARSVGAAHQFLRKPCDSLTLQSTIKRMCSLDVFLRNERLRSMASKMTVLPSLPGVYFKVLRELESPNSSAQSIGDIVAEDPGMTAKMLQLVNSAFFGISRKVAHPAEAVQLLGVNTVRSLALSIHAFSCFDQRKATGIPLSQIWTHSVETGRLAKQIASRAGASPSVAEEAFIAGLLHDLGELMFAANLPGQYAEALELARRESLPIAVAEQRVFDASHADLGGYLLGLWGLPVAIVEAVALHHTPAKSATRTFAPLTAVHVADILCREQTNPPEHGATAELDSAYLEEVGFAAAVAEWRKTLSESRNGDSTSAAA